MQVVGACYGVVATDEIGETVFLDNVDAERKALEYLNSHKVIKPGNMKFIDGKAFSYIRRCDNRKMVSWFAIMDDGKAYIKEFLTFKHIIDYGSVEKAKKMLESKFMKQREFESVDYKEENLSDVIFLKNMYKCGDGCDWDYAESGYSGCIK